MNLQEKMNVADNVTILVTTMTLQLLNLPVLPTSYLLLTRLIARVNSSSHAHPLPAHHPTPRRGSLSTVFHQMVKTSLRTEKSSPNSVKRKKRTAERPLRTR